MEVNANRNILYPKAQWYFALAAVITWIGFSKSYFGRFFQTDIYHHIHGTAAGLWILTLIVQPVLYQKNQLQLHRCLGRWAAFLIAPLFILAGIKMMQAMVQNPAAYPPGEVYRLAYIDLCSLVLFSLFLILGIRFGKNVQLHARFIAGTVLIIIPPAVARALFLISWFDSFDKTLHASFVLTELAVLLMIRDDHRKGKLRSPYLLLFLLLAGLTISLNFIGGIQWWHQAMDRFALF